MTAFSLFIKDCENLYKEAVKLAKEIDNMTNLCLECHAPLTDDEVKECSICNKCLDRLQNDERDERRHPDDNGRAN